MMAKVRRVSMAAEMVGSACTSGNLTGARANAADERCGALDCTRADKRRRRERETRSLRPGQEISGSAPDRIVALGELLHVLAVFHDRVADLGGALPRQGTGVGDRAADADVVADDVLARRISLHVVEIDLLHAEIAGFVASVVGLVPF